MPGRVRLGHTRLFTHSINNRNASVIHLSCERDFMPSDVNGGVWFGVRHQQDGGGERDRTDDLLLAKQALSQLSYTPAPGRRRRERAARIRLLCPCLFLHAEWWAREDLNLRPHAYQARALTS